MKPWIDQLVHNDAELNAAFLTAKHHIKGGEIGQLIFKKWEHKRSLEQNRTMWMWNHEIAQWLTENTDFDVDQNDVHEFLCKKFWPQTINPLTKLPRRVETHKFNLTQMSYHLEQIELWAGKKEIPLTIPAEYPYVS